MRPSIMFGVTLVLSSACTERGPQPSELEANTADAKAKPAEAKPAEAKPAEAKPAEAKPAEAKPAEAKPAEAKPAEVKPAEAKPLDLFAPASEVFAEVRRRWCESGDEYFRPPGPEDEAWPPRLDSCADLRLTTHSQLDAGAMRAQLVTLSAPLQSRELLLLQSTEHAALLETYSLVEDTSGEAPTDYRSHESIELRDLTGTPVPEWTARVSVTAGDSYEADRCFANQQEERVLIVCSESASGFACGTLYYWNLQTSTRRENLDECGIPAAELPEEVVSGFARELELARDRIVLTPAKLDIDEPEDPELAGEVALAELLAEPLEMLATQSRTSVTTP
jgi:hypothetical protein